MSRFVPTATSDPSSSLSLPLSLSLSPSLSALAQHELRQGWGRLEYTSPNIRALIDRFYAKIQTPNREHFVEINGRSPEIYLGTMFANVNLRFSSAAKKAFEEALENLSDDIDFEELAASVVVTPTYVQAKDNATGVELMVSTDGVAYLNTASGAGVQISPDSLQVKEASGSVRSLDTQYVKKSVQVLSDALAAEAKYWIDILSPSTE